MTSKKVTKVQEKTRREFITLRSHLESLFNEDEIPSGIVGDLHDFYFTINRISNFFQRNFLRNETFDSKHLKENIYSLELFIEEQLQIIDDLLPALKRLNAKR